MRTGRRAYLERAAHLIGKGLAIDGLSALAGARRVPRLDHKSLEIASALVSGRNRQGGPHRWKRHPSYAPVAQRARKFCARQPAQAYADRTSAARGTASQKTSIWGGELGRRLDLAHLDLAQGGVEGHGLAVSLAEGLGRTIGRD